MKNRIRQYRAYNPKTQKFIYSKDFSNLSDFFSWVGSCAAILDDWTGITDKNGVDVYEGDIISKMAYNGQNYQLDGVVVFDQGGFCLKCTKHRDPESIGKLFAFSIYGNAEQLGKGIVIGNIHQHAHLLNA